MHPTHEKKTLQYSRVVSLSQTITTNIPIWPGDPKVQFEVVASLETEGYFLRRFTIGEHSATHTSQQLIEIESLGEFDPAIFTAVHNYYYEDVAIKMPNDQILGGPSDGEDDEDDDNKIRNRHLDRPTASPSTPSTPGDP